VKKRKAISWRVRGLVMARAYSKRDGCFFCGFCSDPLTHDDVVIDHVLPLALGGTNEPDNLTVLCWRCNSLKRALHPDDVEEALWPIIDPEGWAEINGR
jgi:5-methylcytosine-specific restriction endonuclease McrA